MAKPNPYVVLGIWPDADHARIQAAYDSMCLAYAPDNLHLPEGITSEEIEKAERMLVLAKDAFDELGGTQCTLGLDKLITPSISLSSHHPDVLKIIRNIGHRISRAKKVLLARPILIH